MAKKIKQALKQLRKALHEQREYEMFLRAEASQRFSVLTEKLLPLMPLLMSKLASSSNEELPTQASQLLLLTKLVRSLTDEQVAAIQKQLSLEQKKCLLELLRSITREAPSSTSKRQEPPVAPQPEV